MTSETCSHTKEKPCVPAGDGLKHLQPNDAADEYLIVVLHIVVETHLVFKGQGLSYISWEAIYDDTISIWNLHDLLLDLSYCCLLKKTVKVVVQLMLLQQPLQINFRLKMNP